MAGVHPTFIKFAIAHKTQKRRTSTKGAVRRLTDTWPVSQRVTRKDSLEGFRTEKEPAVPGFTIGDNVVIGAERMVMKDIPSNVVALGNPCRVLREVNKQNREYYFKNHKIAYDSLK